MTITADLMDPPTPAEARFSARDQALLTLIGLLRAERYSFITPTPATHARVVARGDRQRARSLTDVFGWSLPFAADLIAPEMLALLKAAGAVAQEGELLRSKVRVSSLGDGLYLHSAFPTDAQDAVFFGPDSYRYADLIRTELAHCPDRPGARMADIGGGSGVGAIVAAGCCPTARVLMTDINDEALRIGRINAAAAGVAIDTIACSGLDAVDPPLDVVMLNPPYIIDDAGRAYRDGGGMHGGELSLQMTRQAIERLAPRGRVILYTGSAIVDGRDELKAALEDTAAEQGCTLRYRELDPDVFGEELDKPQYADVDRIAVVAAILQRD